MNSGVPNASISPWNPSCRLSTNSGSCRSSIPNSANAPVTCPIKYWIVAHASINPVGSWRMFSAGDTPSNLILLRSSRPTAIPSCPKVCSRFVNGPMIDPNAPFSNVANDIIEKKAPNDPMDIMVNFQLRALNFSPTWLKFFLTPPAYWVATFSVVEYAFPWALTSSLTNLNASLWANNSSVVFDIVTVPANLVCTWGPSLVAVLTSFGFLVTSSTPPNSLSLLIHSSMSASVSNSPPIVTFWVANTLVSFSPSP